MPRGVKIFGDENSEIITHVVTVAKCIIYDARRKQIRPAFAHFKVWLKRDFVTEKYIARKNDNIGSFIRKWSALHDDLSP